MAFDDYFSSSTVVKPQFRKGGSYMDFKSDGERLEVATWIEEMARPVGGWQVSFDATFGAGEWRGRRRGKRRDRRDGLAVLRRQKRGYDGDDALQCFRKFMSRVAPRITWIAAAEPNPNRSTLNPGFHIHAMLAGLNLRADLCRKKMHDLWAEENGWSQVNLIRSAGACADYCTKHLVRRALLLEWRFGSHDLWQRNQVSSQGSRSCKATSESEVAVGVLSD